ncbi:MAG: histidine ammonia-lyase [Gemmatimonadota bacterium]
MSTHDETIRLGQRDLTIEDVVAVAREGRTVPAPDETVVARMEETRSWVDAAVRGDGAAIYGVNTGFGSLATRRIAPEETGLLSRNVILKCLVGVGPPLPPDVVRAMLLIRAASLARGFSGVRPAIVGSLIEMLNRGVTPIVPSKGSLGASGDLAPCAHIAAVATRAPDTATHDHSGEAWYEGERLSGEEAMRQAGIERFPTGPKEGLALTNGTGQMVASGALALHDAEELVRHAEIAAALSMEALLCLSSPLHPALHEANGQPGQIRTAAHLRRLLAESRLIDTASERVQDAYSIRCTPQVLGPIRDTLAFLRHRFTGAINAAADNPLIFPSPNGDYEAVSGGNFHGQGPALWLDILGIAVAEAAGLAERRTFRLLTPELSGGLPAMLVHAEGLNSGLMAIQYTAAALVSENKTLAHPDSVDSIPSSANQEDHVSMGANAARHTLEIVDNVRTVIAIEFLTAAQAIHLRCDGPNRLGRGTAAAYGVIRQRIPPVEYDRELSPDIGAIDAMIRSGEILDATREAVGAEDA